MFYEDTMKEKVSFKSRITFVDRKTFNKFKKGTPIFFKHDMPNIIKDKIFYSEDIRTCTGGGVVTPAKEAEGFHLLDDVTNYKNIHDFIVYIFRYVKDAQRGLLLGSKELDTRPYSVKIFEKIKDAFYKRLSNVSIFERHTYSNSQTHFMYSLKDDTWTLCTGYRMPDTETLISVSTPMDLKRVFGKISIAEGDSLFIKGKEITPEMMPEFFKTRKTVKKK